jgi:Protein of unknown function (DUF2628)
MTTFTLHLPRDARPGDPVALDRAELVKDAFSWGAFFFTALWFFAHRLWLAGLGILVVLIAFNVALNLLDVHPAAAFVAQVLLSTLIGLEANSLRRWTLTRRGLPAVDSVTAADRDEAEIKGFARWLQRTLPPAPPRNLAAPNSATRRSEPVIGLFPDAEGYR